MDQHTPKGAEQQKNKNKNNNNNVRDSFSLYIIRTFSSGHPDLRAVRYKPKHLSQVAFSSYAYSGKYIFMQQADPADCTILLVCPLLSRGTHCCVCDTTTFSPSLSLFL